MARKKKSEPCEYCEFEEYELLNDSDIVENASLEIFVDFRMKQIAAYVKNTDTDEATEGTIDISYCPFCGRKLDDEY